MICFVIQLAHFVELLIIDVEFFFFVLLVRPIIFLGCPNPIVFVVEIQKKGHFILFSVKMVMMMMMIASRHFYFDWRVVMLLKYLIADCCCSPECFLTCFFLSFSFILVIVVHLSCHFIDDDQIGSILFYSSWLPIFFLLSI